MSDEVSGTVLEAFGTVARAFNSPAYTEARQEVLIALVNLVQKDIYALRSRVAELEMAQHTHSRAGAGYTTAGSPYDNWPPPPAQTVANPLGLEPEATERPGNRSNGEEERRDSEHPASAGESGEGRQLGTQEGPGILNFQDGTARVRITVERLD